MKTAVEFLFDQINDALIDFTEGKISAAIYGIKVTEYKQQAKEMEKEQIIDAHIEGQRVFDDYKHTQWTTDQADYYYNETFK